MSMNFLSVLCPNCRKPIKAWAVKEGFRCPHCGTELNSNKNTANIILILVFTVVSPVFWWVSEIVLKRLFEVNAPTATEAWPLMVLFAILTYFAVYPSLLRLQRKEERSC